MAFKIEQRVFDINFGFGWVEYVNSTFGIIRVNYEYEGELIDVSYTSRGELKHYGLISNIPTLCVREYLLTEIGDVENINSQSK